MNFKTLTLTSFLLALGSTTACTKNMKARDAHSVPALTPKITMTSTFHSLADLPRCDGGTETLNAYVSERDVFVQCRSFFWRDIKPGDISGRFQAREAIRFNEWVDRSTRLRWSLPKQAEVALATIHAGICTQGSKLPTRDELEQASLNGLFEGLKAHGGVAFDKAWTASLDAIAGVSKGSVITVLPQSEGQDPAALTAGVYCVASIN